MSNNDQETAGQRGDRVTIDLTLTYNQCQALLILLSDRKTQEDYNKWRDWIKEELNKIEKILRDKGVYEL